MSEAEEIPEKKEKKDTSDLISINLEGYEVIEKEVKSSGNTGRIYLPTPWIGARVKIIRISPLKTDQSHKDSI